MTHTANYLLGLLVVIVLSICCAVFFALGVAVGRFWRDSRRSARSPVPISQTLYTVLRERQR